MSHRYIGARVLNIQMKISIENMSPNIFPSVSIFSQVNQHLFKISISIRKLEGLIIWIGFILEYWKKGSDALK